MIDYHAEVAKDLDHAEWLIKRLPAFDRTAPPDAPLSGRYRWHVRLTVVLSDAVMSDHRTVANAVGIMAGRNFPTADVGSAMTLLMRWYEEHWLKSRGYLTEEGDWTERGVAELTPKEIP